MLHFIVLLLLFSCARAPLENRKDALKAHDQELSFFDDQQPTSLIQALEENISALKKKPELANFTFGEEFFSIETYLQAMEFLHKRLKAAPTKENVSYLLKNYFKPYAVYGRDDYGEILLTSYYAPVIRGSKEPSGDYRVPLYKKPDDIVEIDLSTFPKEDYGDEFPIERKVYGRLLADKSKRGQHQVISYYSREDIDLKLKLEDEKLILCWVDPIDSFFLQIQGSGTVVFEDGDELNVGYAGQNGRKYEAIGKHLKEHIPEDKMSLQSIENHLRKIPHMEMMNILKLNPSYVFFRKLDSRPVTTLNTQVVGGRTLAADVKFFPKGAIAFLEYERPVFDENMDVPVRFEKSSRVVIDHDTGGAINGGDRFDLFWGKGNEARAHAGVMRHPGKLYYLAPNKKLLKLLENKSSDSKELTKMTLKATR